VADEQPTPSTTNGLDWLTFLSPPFGMSLFMYIAVLGLIGVLARTIWLLTVGVDEARWLQRGRGEGVALDVTESTPPLAFPEIMSN
jgi:hypothetical protein